MPSKSSSSPSSHSPSSSAAPPERRLSLLLLLVAANQRMLQLVDRELKAEGVGTSHYAALSTVGAFGPLPLTELAAELGMPLTTASDVVKRLEAAGQVTRRRNPDDGRSILLELTGEGDADWRRGWPALVRINERLGEQIDVEATRDALIDLSRGFDAAMQNSDQP